MPYHFGNNKYQHLVGGNLNGVLIKHIEYSPDDVFIWRRMDTLENPICYF